MKDSIVYVPGWVEVETGEGPILLLCKEFEDARKRYLSVVQNMALAERRKKNDVPAQPIK
ncbi:MAG: hypothetical protein NT072_13105 [Deltaproteobacteria bacterium]|nr:hypothetical protein [Deltaproteobacteria bacterium]